MQSRFLSLAAAVFITLPFSLSAADSLGVLELSAGSVDRHLSPVSVVLPESLQGKALKLIDSDGREMPVQIDGENRLWTRVEELKAGDSIQLQIREGAPATQVDAVLVQRRGGKLEIRQGPMRILDYQAEPGPLPRTNIDELYRRGAYIHPVYTPLQTVITDDFPINHIHHHGIWFPWTKTEFEGRQPDFWNMGAGTGRVEFKQLNQFWSGSVHGGFESDHQFIDMTAPSGEKVVLNETWRVTVYSIPRGEGVWIFDLESTQTCATDQPLLLPEYRYGGLGFRGHADWDGVENAYYLTANGETDRIKGHATRARWCHIGGKTDGELAGVAILGHPDNFRSPQPMRIHPTEPFFNFAPQQAGNMAIRPGEPYVSKYRFVVSDGEPDPELLDRLWEAYANPMTAQIKLD